MRAYRPLALAALVLAGMTVTVTAGETRAPAGVSLPPDVPTSHVLMRRSERRRPSTSSKAEYKAALRAGYKPLSDLTGGAYPAFSPGIGAVFARRDQMPAGPFLAFDHKGQLVSTIYKIPMSKLSEKATFEAKGEAIQPVDHVSGHFSGSHPGVDFPHYSLVFWHIPKKDEDRVAQ